MESLKSPARTYRGVPHDERRAQRRAQLIAAGVTVYGERGFRHATVKAVCEAAGLTERYFYESFSNSDELLIACFQTVTERVMVDIRAAARDAGASRADRVRAILRTYFTSLKNEPRSARVFLVEIRGVSRAVDKALDTALRAIGSDLARFVAPVQAAPDPLLQAGIVGGVIHIALRWIEDDYSPDVETVIASALPLMLVRQ